MLIPSNQRGFTIVELLIVIVIIGVLAAITIIAFKGVQNRTYDAAVQNDLLAFSKKIEIYFVDNYRYPLTSAELSTMQFRTSQNSYAPNGGVNFLYCHSASGDQYAAVAVSKSFSAYSVDSNARSPKSYGSAVTSQGGVCPTFSLPATGNFWGYNTSVWQSWTL